MDKGKLSRGAVMKRKATDKRQEIPDAGAAGLRLVIQPKPSGAKSWAMRFRRPSGEQGNLSLGPFDASDREAVDTPVIGQALTVVEAHALAAAINLQRARGIDVIALQRAERQRQGSGIADRTHSAFPVHVRDHVDQHLRPNVRRWREVARILGLNFPLSGDQEPTIIKGGLCERWRDLLLREIDGDTLYAVMSEAVHHGIPGLRKKGKGPSDARGRKIIDALGTLFWWLKQHRRIKTNPSVDVHRPAPPKKGKRVLNVKLDIRNADELRWFWAACDHLGAYGSICKLLLLTGCRREEIARMNVEELNTGNAMLSLPGERTKNHLPHLVPLPALAQEIIESVPRVSNYYVFSTTGQTPMSGFSKYKKRLDELMLIEARKERGTNVTIPKWKLHDLRRTVSTGMNGIGILPHVVEAALNHISGEAKSGVAGTYNLEQYLPERVAAYERWATYVAGIISGSNTSNVVSLPRQAVLSSGA
ncbi:integrase [Bradyrhizobium sp. F1.2.2]